MEFHEIAFFKDRGNVPITKIHDQATDDTWPNTLTINMESESTKRSQIKFYLRNESDVISFVNSVKWAYEDYRRRQGYK